MKNNIVIGMLLSGAAILLFSLHQAVHAQDAPDYVLGNLTNVQNLTKEQIQEISVKVTNYTNTLLKAANGNETRLNVLLIEDLAKRNIIDENAKQGFLSFIASLPRPPMETLPGELPGNLTIPGNTDFLNDLNSSSAILDEIAVNNSDSQTVTLMTDILKKRVTDIGTLVSGNGTDTGIVPFSSVEDRVKMSAYITFAAMAVSPGAGSIGTVWALANIANAIQ